MKKLVIFGIVSILLLPLLVSGCGGGVNTIELSLDDFTSENNIVKSIEIGISSSLIVKLGSNPTTGYDWEDVEISDPAVIYQTSRNFLGPEDTSLVGAGGTGVWAFVPTNFGYCTLNFSYGQSWEGGEKDAFTLTINVTVK